MSAFCCYSLTLPSVPRSSSPWAHSLYRKLRNCFCKFVYLNLNDKFVSLFFFLSPNKLYKLSSIPPYSINNPDQGYFIYELVTHRARTKQYWNWWTWNLIFAIFICNFHLVLAFPKNISTAFPLNQNQPTTHMDWLLIMYRRMI